jgi:hypothetical protein
MGFFLVLVVACISAGLSSSIASAKGWSSVSWLVVGFLFGPLGLIAAAGLPDRKLRHCLFELSKQNGVSSESLETGRVDPVAQVTSHLTEEHDFQTDLLTTEEEAWGLILGNLPDSLKNQASRESSDLKMRSSKMLIRSDEGLYLAEAKRLCVRRDGIAYWKLVDRS